LLLGLAIGSFLNVAIYRLPVMMERDFTEQAEWFLKNKTDSESEQTQEAKVETEAKKETFNLILPNSTCPHCQHKIKAVENIPVISYLILGGKCSSCKNSISLRYPAIELLTALISAYVAWHYGFSWQLLGALVFSYAMITQGFIDWDTQYLLDDITYPVLWLGLLLNSQNIFTSLENAVVGAAAGYLSLWSVYWAYKLLTKKEGMGHGDFKLMALFGAWMGWQFLPLIILLSSVSGAVLGGLTIITSKEGDAQKPISFGPYLAIAGWVALLWGEQIMQAYLGTFA
jgi:leader peptidase (prepilin peptidase)/N-methyltransferase